MLGEGEYQYQRDFQAICDIIAYPAEQRERRVVAEAPLQRLRERHQQEQQDQRQLHLVVRQRRVFPRGLRLAVGDDAAAQATQPQPHSTVQPQDQAASEGYRRSRRLHYFVRAAPKRNCGTYRSLFVFLFLFLVPLKVPVHVASRRCGAKMAKLNFYKRKAELKYSRNYKNTKEKSGFYVENGPKIVLLAFSKPNFTRKRLSYSTSV